MFDPRDAILSERTYSLGEIIENTNDENLLVTATPENDSDVVEGTIIRIPLKPLVLLGNRGNNLIIANSQQIIALKKYINNQYRLSDLKYLDNSYCVLFKDLHPGIRRRILETTVQTYCVSLNASPEIQQDIIKRLT